MGIVTEAHSYLITSLDLHTFDLEDFKFGRTKITSLRLVDEASIELNAIYSNWTRLAHKIGMSDVKRPNGILVNNFFSGTAPLLLTHSHHSLPQIESALIYDGIRLLSTALQDLDQSQSVDGIQPISCHSGSPWLYGSSLLNYMRPVRVLSAVFIFINIYTFCRSPSAASPAWWTLTSSATGPASRWTS